MAVVKIKDLCRSDRVLFNGGIYYKGFASTEKLLEEGARGTGEGATVAPKPSVQKIKFRNFAEGFGNSEMAVGGIGIWCTTIRPSYDRGEDVVPVLVGAGHVQLIGEEEFAAREVLIPYKLPRRELRKIFKQSKYVDRILDFGNKLRSSL